MRKLAVKNIAEDLRIAMGVRRETIPGSDTIFIKDAERSEIHKAVVHVSSEAECVEGFEPAAVLGVSTLAGAAEGDLCVGERVWHDYCVNVGLVYQVNWLVIFEWNCLENAEEIGFI